MTEGFLNLFSENPDDKFIEVARDPQKDINSEMAKQVLEADLNRSASILRGRLFRADVFQSFNSDLRFFNVTNQFILDEKIRQRGRNTQFIDDISIIEQGLNKLKSKKPNNNFSRFDIRDREAELNFKLENTVFKRQEREFLDLEAGTKGLLSTLASRLGLIK